MQRLDRREAKAFAERWNVVAQAERDELRRTSSAQKFAQLAALMESARALGWQTSDPTEVDEVRARWNRLVAIHHG
jgi:hypothetical protein